MRKIITATALMLALTIPALAGEMGNWKVPPPTLAGDMGNWKVPPTEGDIGQPIASSSTAEPSKTGEMGCPLTATEFALNMLRGLLTAL